MPRLPRAAVAIAVVFAVLAPAVYGRFLPQRFTDYLLFGLTALAVGLIAGRAGLLNVGIGGTFGVAAYTVAGLSHAGILNPFLLLSGALLAALATSLLFALYAVVATGMEYLLLTLLTTAVFFGLPLLLPDLMGGENGLAVKGVVAISFGLDPLRGSGFYLLVGLVVLAWMGASWYLFASRLGKAMTAIGRNPVRLSAMGYSVRGYRTAVTLYAGLMAGSAGWLYALERAFVFPDLMGIGNSVNALIYSLVGGAGTILGPFLGAAGLRYLSEATGQQASQSQLYLALALLVVVYLLPEGVLGWLEKWEER